MADFGWAVKELKAGNYVCRAGWNGPDQYLGLAVPGSLSRMTVPYIYIVTVYGDLVPWLASQADMLGEDWQYPDVIDMPVLTGETAGP